MEYLQSLWSHLISIQLVDALDIVIVAFLIYKIIPVFKATNTARIAKVVVVILAIAWLTGVAKLHTLNFVLNQFLSIGLLALVILFQPELRRMLDHLSGVKLKKFLGSQKPEQEMVPVISQTVAACEAMSKARIGALIVFARDSVLEEYFKTGTVIDGRVSEQLIRNIFFTNAALHDGAMIIRDGRIAAAGCVLPLSESSRLSLDLGTRHRAAVGMSEVSDAVVVVVSEETGAISVAIDGMLKRHLAPQTLERLLHNELCPEVKEEEKNLMVKLRQKLRNKQKGESGSEK